MYYKSFLFSLDSNHTHRFLSYPFSRASHPICPCVQCIYILLLRFQIILLESESQQKIYWLSLICWYHSRGWTLSCPWLLFKMLLGVQSVLFSDTGFTLRDLLHLVAITWVLSFWKSACTYWMGSEEKHVCGMKQSMQGIQIITTLILVLMGSSRSYKSQMMIVSKITFTIGGQAIIK